jgi:hypothetical protein
MAAPSPIEMLARILAANLYSQLAFHKKSMESMAEGSPEYLRHRCMVDECKHDLEKCEELYGNL